MTLAGVLKGAQVRGEVPREWRELRVASLAYDSRRVEKDTLFFAFAGARVDGRQFAREALARGACAVVSELAPSEDMGAPASAPWIQVEHGRKALAVASRNFYERPDERVSLGRLADLARLAVPHNSRGDAGPSLIIVGDVAALAAKAEQPLLAKVS